MVDSIINKLVTLRCQNDINNSNNVARHSCAIFIEKNNTCLSFGMNHSKYTSSHVIYVKVITEN